jgi:hypothetical protein
LIILYLVYSERHFYIAVHEGQIDIIISFNIHGLSLEVLENVLSVYKDFDDRRHMLSDTAVSVRPGRQVAPPSAYREMEASDWERT